MKCLMVRFLYKIIPVKRGKAFLIHRHFSQCPVCREEFYAADLEGPIGFTPDKVPVPPDLRQDIREQIKEFQDIAGREAFPGKTGKNRKQILKKIQWSPETRFTWKWAAAGAVILLLVIPFLLLRNAAGPLDTEKSLIAANRSITIKSIKVEDRPAQVVYFQPGSKNRLIVWVKRR